MPVLSLVTISCAVLFGMMLALQGQLKRALSERYHLGEGRLSVLLGILNISLLPMVLVAGVLVDSWSVRGVLILGSVFLALGIVQLGRFADGALSFSATVLHALLALQGAVALCVVAVVLMPSAFFRPGLVIGSLQLGHGFMALGALIAPVLAALLVRGMDVRRTAALFAILSLVPAFLAVLPLGDQFEATRTYSPNLRALLSHHLFWLAGVVVFFYAPLEGSVTTWVSAFAMSPEGNRPQSAPPAITQTHPGITVTGAGTAGQTQHLSMTAFAGQGRQPVRNRWLAGFWITFVLSRLLTGWLLAADYLAAGWDLWVLFLLVLSATITLGRLFSSSEVENSRIGLVVLGFFLGPIFPTVAGILFRHFHSEWGTAYASLWVFGSVSSLLTSRMMPTTRPQTLVGRLALPLLLAVGLTLSTLLTAMLAL